MTDGFFRYVCKDCGKTHLISISEIADFANKNGNTKRPTGRKINEYLKEFKIRISCPEDKRVWYNKPNHLYDFTEFIFYLGERGDDIWCGSPHLDEDLILIKR